MLRFVAIKHDPEFSDNHVPKRLSNAGTVLLVELLKKKSYLDVSQE